MQMEGMLPFETPSVLDVGRGLATILRFETTCGAKLRILKLNEKLENRLGCGCFWSEKCSHEQPVCLR